MSGDSVPPPVSGQPTTTAGTAPAATPVTTSAAAVMKLVQDQLAEERATKTSLETRAVAVITSSGALATLLFALAALVTKATTYQLPDAARVVLVLTLLAFTLAGVLAIFVARPSTYQEVKLDSLKAVASPEAMNAPATEGEPEIAKVLVNIIEGARKANADKAGLLRYAVISETAAAVLLAVTVAIVLLNG